jgi:hypothetical protein
MPCLVASHAARIHRRVVRISSLSRDDDLRQRGPCGRQILRNTDARRTCADAGDGKGLTHLPRITFRAAPPSRRSAPSTFRISLATIDRLAAYAPRVSPATTDQRLKRRALLLSAALPCTTRTFREPAAARPQERATANSRPPPMSYFAFALAAAAAVAEGSAKAITASPSSKL